MLTFVARRILLAIVVVVGVIVVTFLVAHVVPGDPAATWAGPHASAAQIARARQFLGLNRPLIVQILSYLGGIAKGNWGMRLAGTGEIGAITGTGSTMAGSGALRLRLFSSSARLKPGDQLVTFGSVNDTPYVPGVPVGTVISVSSGAGSLTQSALVRPFADFTSLGVVGVVVAKPRTNPRDSVLPGKAG